MYTATTHGFRVTVFPAYLPDQSDAEAHIHTWAYFIRIENESEESAQLINRSWHITDATGQVQKVQGAGVVGEQPIIEPGESHHYTSGVSLTSASGIMQGYYEMLGDNGESFHIQVPAFSLDSPEAMTRAN